MKRPGTGNFGRATTWVTLMAFMAGLTAFPAAMASAQGLNVGQIREAALAAELNTLKVVPVPEPANLSNFLNAGADARRAAIRLGKALFWDMQVGSDGQACASCHFHAGADSRVRNQISPGLKATPQDPVFGNNLLGVPGFPKFRPDYSLVKGDFPLHVLQDPEENNFDLRVVLSDTNDVVSSMGVFAANFTAVAPPFSFDIGVPFVDPIFNRDNPSAFTVSKNVRRVEPRNTPTMINAVFNHSNFWDGRAHNHFNGVSVIGPLDPDARIWVADRAGRLSRQAVRIPDSSLASQAVGPPTSDLEMSFFNRPFPMIGRKLIGSTPLALQAVDPSDGVLGPLSRFPDAGINATYEALIKSAFQPKYWSSGREVVLPAGTFTQMEANFTLFFGLAVQMYESILVSDDTPFDKFMAGDDHALTDGQLRGLLVFINRGQSGGVSRNPAEVDAAIAAAQAALGAPIGSGNCSSCHGGPEMTDASVTSVAEELMEIEETPVLIGGLLAVGEEEALLDQGFSNIGVRPVNDDLGRGGLENGFPLSFSRQLLFNPVLLKGVLPPADAPCKAGTNCPGKLQVDGAFKIPGLRNVELTGPYFHNGGQATLDQVVEFYDRQSDFGDVNIANLDRNMAFIDLHDADEGPLVEFLLALTDERVRQEQAPFDHPGLLVPEGGTFANERPRIEVPPVGAGGRPAAGMPPLGTFLGLSHLD